MTKSIELVKSKYGRTSWLVNPEGERITRKFFLNSQNTYGNFIHINTNIGNFVYNLMQSEILYSDAYPRWPVCVEPLNEHIYKIKGYSQYYATLYNAAGKILINNLTFVAELKNGRILAQQYNKFGYIDGEANIVIPFKYFNGNSFNEFGFAVVSVDAKRKTIIDKMGNELFEPIECRDMKMLTPNRIWLKRDSGEGIIDDKGNVIIPTIYDRVWQACGFFVVIFKRKHGLFNNDGGVEFDTIYDEIIETPEKFVVKDFARIEIPKLKEVTKNTTNNDG